jgi:carbamoyltransferase
VLIGAGAAGTFLRLVAHRPTTAVSVVAAGIAVAALSLVPGLGRLLFVGWMMLGAALGMLTSPIVLGAVWILVFTPVGLAMRLAGRDPMKRKILPQREGTYWERHPPAGDPRRYFRQF